ncbi:hypothetical protein [Persicirhabdus sediminis]|uniref:Uncharacterized protein n=1 Tax=Persicirhabdus sediminis TaxID=454144 RepID=A0A8J7MCL1_9BACT|nr:hypothetical protein [Persicirhabdus sediminis]MBK1790123.1 hypothetical protein [Persicirhabdus sediminis]
MKALVTSISIWLMVAAGQAGISLQDQLNEAHEQFVSDVQERNLAARFKVFEAPPKAREIAEEAQEWQDNEHPWRRGITADIFYIGQKPFRGKGKDYSKSAWDPNWQENYGGVDHPVFRKGYAPRDFIPKSNPFYIALPYNDLLANGARCPYAAEAVPWFWKVQHTEGKSVCQNRWVALHYRGKVCYAQWQDVGPYAEDDWAYVFKARYPALRLASSPAAIQVSPAVRDYLGMQKNSRISWKFIEEYEVIKGPWLDWKLPGM